MRNSQRFTVAQRRENGLRRQVALYLRLSAIGLSAAFDAGIVDAAMLSVPENILARQKGFNELAFSGDYIEFPQNGFGASIKKIKDNPDEIYRMVRGTLRGLMFVSDNKNKDACLDMIAKHWSVKNRAMASEMYDYMVRVMLRDGAINMNGLQALVDQQRERTKFRAHQCGSGDRLQSWKKRGRN